MQLLRRAKVGRQPLFDCAVRTSAASGPVMRVTAALTDLAVASVQSALRYLLRQESRRARQDDRNQLGIDPRTTAGLVVLAMGKMGAGAELNYSSDNRSDRVFRFPQHQPSRLISSRNLFSCASTQALGAACCSSATGDGYVFPRSICGLRPDPASTQGGRSRPEFGAGIITSGKGGTWERAAMIKARPPCRAGRPPKAGEGAGSRKSRPVRLAQASGIFAAPCRRATT